MQHSETLLYADLPATTKAAILEAHRQLRAVPGRLNVHGDAPPQDWIDHMLPVLDEALAYLQADNYDPNPPTVAHMWCLLNLYWAATDLLEAADEGTTSLYFHFHENDLEFTDAREELEAYLDGTFSPYDVVLWRRPIFLS